ncbi:MAG: glycosyltransferase [Pseudomonadota bacterium]
MRVLLLTHWLSNHGGGVPTVVAALARAIADLDGIEVYVSGLVKDVAERAHQDWGTATVDPVVPKESRLIGYAPEIDRLIVRLAPDVVHLHGLWTYPSIAAARWRVRSPESRLVISPHGMLEPWALANSGWKKRLAGAVFQRWACAHADLLHGLTSAETAEIRAYCGPKPVAEIPNGVTLPAPDGTPAALRTARRMLYLGRIHPKKNLGFLLDLWARSDAAAKDWTLQIAGWDQEGTQARLQAQARALGIADNVVFSGPLFGADKDAAFRNADAFVLPSLSEGLPMVVLEAWSHDLPVLMTDACNLPDGFAQGAAQRLEAADIERGSRDLTAFLSQPGEALVAMGAAGYRLVRQSYPWEAIGRKFIAAYGWTLGRRDKPDFIRE